jgi:hypothetical protein
VERSGHPVTGQGTPLPLPGLDRRGRSPVARLQRLGYRYGSRAIDAGIAGDVADYVRLLSISTGFYNAARLEANRRLALIH